MLLEREFASPPTICAMTFSVYSFLVSCRITPLRKFKGWLTLFMRRWYSRNTTSDQLAKIGEGTGISGHGRLVALVKACVQRSFILLCRDETCIVLVVVVRVSRVVGVFTMLSFCIVLVRDFELVACGLGKLEVVERVCDWGSIEQSNVRRVGGSGPALLSQIRIRLPLTWLTAAVL